MYWWYHELAGNDVVDQVTYAPNISNGSAARTVTFSNVTWSDNAASDQARASSGSTATAPPAASSAALSASGSEASGSDVVDQDGGPQNVLFQHGLFSSGATWKRMNPWLDDDFRLGTVLIPSLPWQDALADQGQDLIGVLDGVSQNGFLLIGHSQGGLIARYAAQHYQQLGSPKVSGVITLDAPNQGAPLAASGFVAADAAMTNAALQLFDDAGCYSPFDSFVCFTAYATALGVGGLTDYGVYSSIPALTDLIPDSNFLQTLNTYPEKFPSAGIISQSNGRWLPMRLAGDYLCGHAPGERGDLGCRTRLFGRGILREPDERHGRD